MNTISIAIAVSLVLGGAAAGAGATSVALSFAPVTQCVANAKPPMPVGPPVPQTGYKAF